MHSLPVFVRLRGERVLVLGAGTVADAKRRLVERAGAIVTDDVDAQVRLAFVAVEDAAEAARLAAGLKARGMLLNVADQPELCDFTLPAIVDRDPVIVAIGTGGASAGLAKALRQRLETILPATLGALADKLSAARDAMRARWPDPNQRRRALDDLLMGNQRTDIFEENADKAVDAWLAEKPNPMRSISHFVLASDDPDDLSLRAARLLGQADEVWHHPAIAPAILHRARADAKRVASTTAPPETAAQGGKIVMWLTRT